MEIDGKVEIMQDMINIRKRELGENLKLLKEKLRACKKSRTELRKKKLETDGIECKISELERKIFSAEEELKFYTAQYQPIRLFDTVINYKLFKSILQKTKNFNVGIQKGDGDTVEISWEGKGSRGSYTLNNLAVYYENIIYIPELIVQE